MRRAKKTTLQEGGNFLKNINLFIGVNRGRNEKNRTLKVDNGLMLDSAQGNNTQGGLLNFGSDNCGMESQLLRVSSEDSSSSCDDGGESCNSPVIRQTATCASQSPFRTSGKPNLRSRKPMPYRNDCKNNTASLTTLKIDEPRRMCPKPLKRQASGVKKEVTSNQAARGSLRRIHSMYTSKKEVSRELDLNRAHALDNESTFEDGPQCLAYESRLSSSGMPHYYNDSTDDNLPRIGVETLVEILDGAFKNSYGSVHVVDCRFEYEYEGGHIGEAINMNSRSSLEQEFIHKKEFYCREKSPPLIVFHCEFSSYRGPIMASHLRNCDRMLNYDNYPKLFYPDILIVEGGYKSFFEKYSHRCFPRRYIAMGSQDHIKKCESEMEKFRRDSKRVITKTNSFQSLSRDNTTSASATVKLGSKSQSLLPDYGKFDDFPLPFNYTTNTNLSFKYEAPPKLSLSRYSVNSSTGSPTSATSSSISSRALLLDELHDDLRNTDLEDISFEDSGPFHSRCGSTDSALAFKGVEKPPFDTIFTEEEVDST